MKFDIRCNNKKFRIDAENIVEAVLKIIDTCSNLESYVEFDVIKSCD